MSSDTRSTSRRKGPSRHPHCKADGDEQQEPRASRGASSMLPTLLFIPSHGPPVKAVDAICWRSLEGRSCLTPAERRLAAATSVVIIPIAASRRAKATPPATGTPADLPCPQHGSTAAAPATSGKGTSTSCTPAADVSAPTTTLTAPSGAFTHSKTTTETTTETTTSTDPVLAACEQAAALLGSLSIPYSVDADPKSSAGSKFHSWERLGVPLRLEVGPREAQQGLVSLAVHPHYACMPGVCSAVQSVLQQYCGTPVANRAAGGAGARQVSAAAGAGPGAGAGVGAETGAADGAGAGKLSTGAAGKGAGEVSARAGAGWGTGGRSAGAAKLVVPLDAVGDACALILAAVQEVRQQREFAPPCTRLHLFANTLQQQKQQKQQKQQQQQQQQSQQEGSQQRLHQQHHHQQQLQHQQQQNHQEASASLGPSLSLPPQTCQGTNANLSLEAAGCGLGLDAEVCSDHLRFLAGAGRACHCGVGHVPLSHFKAEAARRYEASHPGATVLRWTRGQLYAAHGGKQRGPEGGAAGAKTPQQADGNGSKAAPAAGGEALQAEEEEEEEEEEGLGRSAGVGVFVSRIPMDVPLPAVRAQLHQAFEPFGAQHVMATRTRNGCTHGWAKVQLPSLEQAHAAVQALNGSLRLHVGAAGNEAGGVTAAAGDAVSGGGDGRGAPAVQDGAVHDGNVATTREPAGDLIVAAAVRPKPGGSGDGSSDGAAPMATSPQDATGAGGGQGARHSMPLLSLPLLVTLPTGRKDALFPGLPYHLRRQLRVDSVAAYSVADQPAAERMAGLVAAVAATLWDLPQPLAPLGRASSCHASQPLAPLGSMSSGNTPPPLASARGDVSSNHASQPLASLGGTPSGNTSPPLNSPRDPPCGHAAPTLKSPWDASCGHGASRQLPLTATDGNACCGGTTLALLGAFQRVKAVELDEDRCADLVHNLRVLGYAPTPALPGDPECVPVPGLCEKEEGAAVAGLAEPQEGVMVPGFDEKEEGAAVAGLVQGMECVAEARGRGAREVQVACGDYVQLSLRLRQHLVFLDPPWGGPQYNRRGPGDIPPDADHEGGPEAGEAEPFAPLEEGGLAASAGEQVTIGEAGTGGVTSLMQGRESPTPDAPAALAAVAAAAGAGRGSSATGGLDQSLVLGTTPIVDLCADLLLAAAVALGEGEGEPGGAGAGAAAAGGPALTAAGGQAPTRAQDAGNGDGAECPGQSVAMGDGAEGRGQKATIGIGAENQGQGVKRIAEVTRLVVLRLPSKVDCVEVCHTVRARLLQRLQQQHQQHQQHQQGAQGAALPGAQAPARPGLSLLAVHAQFGRSSLLLIGVPRFPATPLGGFAAAALPLQRPMPVESGLEGSAAPGEPGPRRGTAHTLDSGLKGSTATIIRAPGLKRVTAPVEDAGLRAVLKAWAAANPGVPYRLLKL